MREKYEAEYRELDYSEKQTKARYNQIKSQMAEIEGKSLIFFSKSTNPPTIHRRK